MTQNELYNLIYQLREKLKKQFTTNGRAPTICTDEALKELASHPPRYKSDFKNIAGFGDTFVEKYADYFLPIFESYYKSKSNAVKLKPEIKETLRSLENRLINISRKNRLLYTGKIYNKNTFDMYSTNLEYNNKVIDLILGKTSQLVLCEMSLKDNWENENNRFKKALQLIREVSRDQKESGQYDLFIGYPYVVGKTFNEDFNIRAPLALFPITFEKKPDKIIIKLDKTKDIMFNSNLIITQNKFLGRADDIPEIIWEDFNSSSFLESILAYYKQHDINISGTLDILEKFEDISVKDFPNYRNGEYYLSNNAVLGKFSPYSSALQKDFRELINSTDINVLVDNLLDKEPSNVETIPQTEFSEYNINYINELNSSQEQAVLSVASTNKLVIQGPPGTGKSQTITSLIADAVNKGKSVLMVSQKKAALDVIYSRLGKLSNFAIMLNDTKNKADFYNQLHNLFNCNKDSNYQLRDFKELSKDIDYKVLRCENIASLYSNKINNTEVIKIYSTNENNFWLQANDDKLFDTYFSFTNKNLLNINYPELCGIYKKFTNLEMLNNLLDYARTTSKYPFVVDMKTSLRALERKSMERAFESFRTEQVEYNKLNFFSRLFKSGERKKKFKKIFKEYFIKSRYKNKLYKNLDNLITGISNYEFYENNRELYNSLTNNEKFYIQTLYNLSNASTDEISNINKKLLDFVIYCNLTDFEDINRKNITNINNFPEIIKEITSSMSEKIILTKEKLKNTLTSAFQNELSSSKRYLEICRQIESNRKWSVNKFMKKFSFELLRGIKIWLMTPETVSELLPLEYGLFDTLIFDEASQIYIEKGLPAISRANNVVVAGDHKQLRPSSLGFGRIDIEDEEVLEDDENNAALEEESLLDLARFKYPSVLLNYHYRSKYEELINFSNYAFYGGRLNVSPNIEEPNTPPIEVVKIDNGQWINRCNKKEAIKVVAIIKNFLKTRQSKDTIGVITFNTNQRDAILDELDRESLKDQEFSALLKKEMEREENGEDIGLFVKNIENVQGDERDHIIFSIGYARNEDGKVVRNFGWLNQQGGENRLNVAISRAKRKITVVTSIFPEELSVSDLKNDGPKLFRKYLEYCFAISRKDKSTATSILNSLTEIQDKDTSTITDPLVLSVGKALTNQGLSVEYNIGYGKYKVDLAIKSKDKSRYVLGIEFDSKLYTNTNTRERDIFRQKYLECRNWKVYRLWSMNWWHNQSKELQAILKLVQSLDK